ncbi:MAG: hypothetical protein D6681_06000 [Calditrichaeota bacterium]|nr:MAG: hypothetical protein D6681_06000 [Calditrichota bacterium]
MLQIGLRAWGGGRILPAILVNVGKPLGIKMMQRVGFLGILMCFVATLWAQQEATSQKRPSVFDVDATQPEKSSEQIVPQAQLVEPAFEKEIDPREYIVGPGDGLLIKIWGVVDEQFQIPVTPDGYVVIPTVAEVFVSGKTLAEAAEAIQQTLHQAFRNSEFSIRLWRMRKFRVFVVGEVRNPGSYYLRGIDRVSDALQLAGGLVDWGDDTRLQIRHLTGEVDTVNISEFFITGDRRYNPLLRAGDVVFVPTIDLKQNYVIIEGNVGSQGVYQIRPGETLFALLRRLRAINRRSDIEHVILFRGKTRKVFNLLKDEQQVVREVLQTGDRIRVPLNRNQVYVQGEVLNPGPYDYLANYTTLDYAGLAGILETAKGLKDLYVIRANSGKIEKGKDVVVERGDIVVVPQRPRENFKDMLSILTPIISVGISAAALIVAARK